MKEKIRKQSFYDDYGFKTDHWTHQVSKYIINEKQVEQKNAKWQSLKQKIPSLKSYQQKELSNLVRQGIADKLRPQIWCLLIDPPQIPYKDSVDKQELKEVDLDISRTIPTNKNIKFIIGDLRKVLNAIAYAIPKMGYCQGLNFITATLLLIMDPQGTYKMLFHILYHKRHMELMINLEGIHKKIYVTERLIAKHFPKVSKHLKQFEIDLLLYCSPWFIALFTSVLPCNYSFRIIQLYFLEGDKVLYRTALQIFKWKKKSIKKMDNIEQINCQLKNFDELDLLHQNDFFRQMFQIKLSRKQIEQLEQDYDKTVLKEQK